MSKYTIQLCNIDKDDIFNFPFTLYGADAPSAQAHKTDFINRFYDYYYFHEINADNVEGFNRMLRKYVALVVPRYNKLFEKATPLLDGSLVSYTRALTEAKEKEGQDTRLTDDALTTRSTFLDTPSTPIGQDPDDYATNITRDLSNRQTSDNIGRNEDENRTLEETYQAQGKVDVYEKLLDTYKDLDEQLIKEFKKCFLLIY